MTRPGIEIDALFEAERSLEAAPAAVRDRLWQRVAESVSAPPSTGPGTEAAVDAAIGAPTAATLAGVKPMVLVAVASTAIMGATIVGVVAYRASPETELVQTPATMSEAAPLDIAEETRLLEEARRAIAAGELSAAERSLAAHQRRFEGGLMAQEREVLQIRLLKARGETTRAKERLDEFRKRFPASPALPGLEAP